MSKGLGGIMAAVAMEEEKDRVEKGEGVACPSCGREMEFNGCAWFCRFDCIDEEAILTSAYEALERGLWIGWGFKDIYDWDASIQGLVFAMVMKEGKPVVSFECVRGGRGRNAIRIATAGDNDNRADVPYLIKKYGWTWQDWFPSEPDDTEPPDTEQMANKRMDEMEYELDEKSILIELEKECLE